VETTEADNVVSGMTKGTILCKNRVVDDVIGHIFGQAQIRILDTGMVTFQFNSFSADNIISSSFI